MLAQRIRERYGERSPEMIMLSSGGVVREKAGEAGIRSVIYKPVRRFQLYDALSSITPEHNQSQQRREEQREIRLQGRVLLVDDEPINQKVAAAILQKFGLEIEVAGNGREAVEKVEAGDYSLVLMDIQMPEMSGFEATEIIRRHEQKEGRRRVVIIAMTANAMETTRQRCLAIGMDDFITKPIRPDVLAERLKPWLGGALAAGVDPGPEGEPPEAAGQMSCWDRLRALQFVGGDSELLDEMIGLFLQRQPQLLARVEAAVLAGDAESLSEAAHAYKGAVSHFAASGVQDLALALERAGKSRELDNARDLWSQLQEEAVRLQEALQQALSRKA
jgi:CheY-like chemotaxis protein